jgi:ABC-2 type transport system permease protein
MAVIWAIMRRDLLGAFTTPLAWLVLALWLFVIDLAFAITLGWAHSSQPYGGLDQPLFDYVLSAGRICLVFIAPAITMGSFTLERSQGTMQLLLTVPAREHQLVVGKFLASFVILAVMIAATVVQPVVLYFISDVPGPQLTAGYGGLLLSAAFYAALGVWISLLVDSGMAAWVITAAVLTVLMLIGMIGVGGWRGEVAHFVGLAHRSEGFFRGEVRLGDIAYFVAGTTAWLLLAHSVLRARRIHG